MQQETKPRPEGFQQLGESEPVIDSVDAAQADAQAAEMLDTWPVVVRLLHKPVRTPKGDYVKELSFREPTGGDINRYGNPCRVNAEGDVVIDEKKMTMVMAALAGILVPHLEAMDPRDWNSCAYRLRGFFLPEAAAWFPAATT